MNSLLLLQTRLQDLILGDELEGEITSLIFFEGIQVDIGAEWDGCAPSDSMLDLSASLLRWADALLLVPLPALCLLYELLCCAGSSLWPRAPGSTSACSCKCGSASRSRSTGCVLRWLRLAALLSSKVRTAG